MNCELCAKPLKGGVWWNGFCISSYSKSRWQRNHLKRLYSKKYYPHMVQARHLKSEANRSDVIMKFWEAKIKGKREVMYSDDPWVHWLAINSLVSLGFFLAFGIWWIFHFSHRSISFRTSVSKLRKWCFRLGLDVLSCDLVANPKNHLMVWKGNTCPHQPPQKEKWRRSNKINMNRSGVEFLFIQIQLQRLLFSMWKNASQISVGMC